MQLYIMGTHGILAIRYTVGMRCCSKTSTFLYKQQKVQSYLFAEESPNSRTEIIDAAFFSTELRMNPAKSQA